jgi:hypothetical protein
MGYQVVEFPRGISAPLGPGDRMSQQPSRSSSAAFLSAATAVSRRTVMLPAVSVPVIKNHMCRPVRRSVTDINSTRLAASIIRKRNSRTPASRAYGFFMPVNACAASSYGCSRISGIRLRISCEYAADNLELWISLQLPYVPICLFAIGLELAHHVSLQRLHYADAGKHCRSAEIGEEQERLDAACHAALSWSAFLTLKIKARAAARVTSCRPRGSGMGSSNSRAQSRSPMPPPLLSNSVVALIVAGQTPRNQPGSRPYYSDEQISSCRIPGEADH